ncbi:MAG: Fe-S cluster assembly protein SufD [Candidatus Sumerlaeaceae bacterium]
MTQVLNDAPAYNSLVGRFSAAGEPQWLRDLREKAESLFAQKGLPDAHDEEWRFTPLGKFPRHEFTRANQVVPPAELLKAVPETFGGWRAVIVNGYFVPSLSTLPHPSSGVEVLALDKAIARGGSDLHQHFGRFVPMEELPFAALNTAQFCEALVVRVASQAKPALPLELIFWTIPTESDPVVSYPRVLVIAEDASRLSLIEVHAGTGDTPYFTNPVFEFHVKPGARVTHYRAQSDTTVAFHIAAIQANVRAQGAYEFLGVNYGARLTRADVRIRLAEPGAETTLYGLYRIDGDQLSDLHSVIEHAAPHCPSWEVVKGILEGRAHGVFNGRIIVRPAAQKTDAKQTNKNLLLSRDAVVNANPQLEIYADDVKCTHGATVGHLDEQALFYLQSRGIAADQARGLLTYAFANDVLRRIEVAALREWLELSILEVEHLAFDRGLLEVK